MTGLDSTPKQEHANRLWLVLALAYGGGAAFITAKEVKTMSTAAWLNEQIA